MRMHLHKAISLLFAFQITGCGFAQIQGPIADPVLSDGLPASTLRIFLTSSSYNGNLGGISGGDSNCQSEATAAGLTRTYKAILSASTTDARDRFTLSGPVSMINSSGAEVAIVASLSDLWSGAGLTLLNQVNLNASGSAQPTGTNIVITGTQSDGTKAANNCTNWTSTGTTLTYGLFNRTDFEWLQRNTGACLITMRLYCLSQ